MPPAAKTPASFRCRANSAQIRPSKPDYGLGLNHLWHTRLWNTRTVRGHDQSFTSRFAKMAIHILISIYTISKLFPSGSAVDGEVFDFQICPNGYLYILISIYTIFKLFPSGAAVDGEGAAQHDGYADRGTPSLSVSRSFALALSLFHIHGEPYLSLSHSRPLHRP